MADGYRVTIAELHSHAGNMDALAARFDAITSASAHITGDGAAYGALCGWIAGILEARHTRQDELIATVRENLTLVATELRVGADDYEGVEIANAQAADSLAPGPP